MPSFIAPDELHEILATLRENDEPNPSEMQSNFSSTHQHWTKTLDLDEIVPDRRVAIHVAADITAPTHAQRGYSTRVYHGGYWKEKATLDFSQLQQRMAGNGWGNVKFSSQAFLSILNEQRRDMEAKRDRLKELNCATLLKDGKYFIVSAKHPSIEIDLGLVEATTEALLNSGSANKADLTTLNANGIVGGRAWDTSTGTITTRSPVDDIEQMLEVPHENISKIYIGKRALSKLLADPKADKMINKDFNNLTMAKLALGPQSFNKEGLKLVGFVGLDNIPIFVYNTTYQPSNSTTEVSFLPDTHVIMVPASKFGLRCQGPIQRADAGYQPMDNFWHSWTEDEAGNPFIQGHSAFTYLHVKPKSIVTWKVVS